MLEIIAIVADAGTGGPDFPAGQQFSAMGKLVTVGEQGSCDEAQL